VILETRMEKKPMKNNLIRDWVGKYHR